LHELFVIGSRARSLHGGFRRLFDLLNLQALLQWCGHWCGGRQRNLAARLGLASEVTERKNRALNRFQVFVKAAIKRQRMISR
jgi:hypothetical protein